MHIRGNKVTLKAYGCFVDYKDECEFYYKEGIGWNKLGITHNMVWKMDQFVGCRVGLCFFSTKEFGGIAEFSNFKYNILK